jgi:hypothetical protein
MTAWQKELDELRLKRDPPLGYALRNPRDPGDLERSHFGALTRGGGR